MRLGKLGSYLLLTSTLKGRTVIKPILLKKTLRWRKVESLDQHHIKMQSQD